MEESVFMYVRCLCQKISFFLLQSIPEKNSIILFNVFHARAVDAFAAFNIVINWVRDICGSIETKTNPASRSKLKMRIVSANVLLFVPDGSQHEMREPFKKF